MRGAPCDGDLQVLGVLSAEAVPWLLVCRGEASRRGNDASRTVRTRRLTARARQLMLGDRQ